MTMRGRLVLSTCLRGLREWRCRRITRTPSFFRGFFLTPLERGQWLSVLRPTRAWIRIGVGLQEAPLDDVPPMRGEVFTDGACYPLIIAELPLAG